jgi:hypothetical protein
MMLVQWYADLQFSRLLIVEYRSLRFFFLSYDKSSVDALDLIY